MTMTPKTDVNSIESICEVLIENGLPGLREALERLLNLAMQIERQEALKAEPYERTAERKGYANGYKERVLQTRLGRVEAKIPQVRGLSFYPQSIERGLRSERALKVAVAEMYLQGVSTRKVEAITEALCGFSISSTQVSRVSQELDTELNRWRERPLGVYPYVLLDARYEKVRYEGCVRDLAVIWAVGITPEGRREVLGVSVSLSEAEVHWRKFLESLQQRGLRGIVLITSDDHSGLKAARRSVYPEVAWQRCQFHLSQNAQSYVAKQEQRSIVAQEIRDIFASPTRPAAEEQLRQMAKNYAESAPRLSEWLESDLAEGFTVYNFPRSHQRKIRTVNMLERINREIRRRTRVATLFPNEAACLRLVSALLMEIHEDWATGNRYLNMNELRDAQVENDELIYRKNVA